MTTEPNCCENPTRIEFCRFFKPLCLLSKDVCHNCGEPLLSPMKNEPVEGWRERLQFEVMEDYIQEVAMRNYAAGFRDGTLGVQTDGGDESKKDLEVLRGHFEKLKSFIENLLTLSKKQYLEDTLRMIEGMKIKRNTKGCYLKGDDGNIYIMDCEYGNCENCEHSGYNQALKALSSTLEGK